MAINDKVLKVAAELDLILTAGKVDASKVDKQLRSEINALVNNVTRSAKTGTIKLNPDLETDKKKLDDLEKLHRDNAFKARKYIGDTDEAYNNYAENVAKREGALAIAKENHAEKADARTTRALKKAQSLYDSELTAFNTFKKHSLTKDTAILDHYAKVQDKLSDVTKAQKGYVKQINRTAKDYKKLETQGGSIVGLGSAEVARLGDRNAAAAIYKRQLKKLQSVAEKGVEWEDSRGQIKRTSPLLVEGLEKNIKGVSDELGKLGKSLNTEAYKASERAKKAKAAATKERATEKEQLRIDNLRRRKDSSIAKTMYGQKYSVGQLNRLARQGQVGGAVGDASLGDLQDARRGTAAVRRELNSAFKKQALQLKAETANDSVYTKEHRVAQQKILKATKSEMDRADAIGAEIDKSIAVKKAAIASEKEAHAENAKFNKASVSSDDALIKSKQALAKAVRTEASLRKTVEESSGAGGLKDAATKLRAAESKLVGAIDKEKERQVKDSRAGSGVSKKVRDARGRLIAGLEDQLKKIRILNTVAGRRIPTLEKQAAAEAHNLRESERQAKADKRIRDSIYSKNVERNNKLKIANANLDTFFGQTKAQMAGSTHADLKKVQQDLALRDASVRTRRDYMGSQGFVGPVQPGAVAALNKELDALGGQQRKLGEVRDGISQTSKELSPFNQKMTQASLLIKQFFRYALGYGALFRMLTAVQQLTRGVIDLDKALYSIKAISGATTEQMSEISGALKEVAVTTKFTTQEVAKGAQILAQAGVDPDQMSSVLKSVALFAAGTESSLQVAADLVSTMRNVYKELDDLTIANQLTKAINISKLTAADLKTILGISAQVTQQFNITSEQYLAAVTTLRNAGLKASTVATGLRQGLLELFSPDSKTLKALQDRYKTIGEQLDAQGIRDKFFNFTQQANPLLAVLRELDRLGFTGSGRKTLARAFDVRAQNAITALIKNMDELERSEARLSSGDAALKASETQMESLANSVSNLGAAMTVLASDISEGPVRALEDVVDSATEAVNALDALHIKSQAMGEDGVLDALTVAAAGGFLGSLVGATPAGRAVGAIGGAVAGGYAGKELLESGVEGEDLSWLSTAADTLTSIILMLSGYKLIVKILGPVTSLLKSNQAAIAATATSAGKHVNAFALLWSKVAVNIGALVGVFTSIFQGGFFKGLAATTTKLWGLAKTMGAFGAVSLLGWASAAAAVIYGIYSLIKDSPQEELEKLKARADSAKRQATKAKQKRTAILDEIAPFKPSDAEEGYDAADSGIAAAVEHAQNFLERNLDAVRESFGERATDNLDEFIKEIVIPLRTTASEEGSPGRLNVYKKLVKDYGVDISGMSTEIKEHTLGVLLDTGQLKNQIEAFKKGLEKDYVRLLNKDPDDLSEFEAARLKAIEEIIATNKNFRAAMQGVAGAMEDTEFLDLYIEMLGKSTDAIEEGQSLIQAEADGKKALTDDIIARFEALQTAIATGEGNASLLATVSNLLAAIRESGMEVTGFYDLLRERVDTFKLGVREEISVLGAATDEAKKELRDAKKSGGWLFGLLDYSPSYMAELEQNVKDATAAEQSAIGEFDDTGKARQSITDAELAGKQRVRDQRTSAVTQASNILVEAMGNFEGVMESLSRDRQGNLEAIKLLESLAGKAVGSNTMGLMVRTVEGMLSRDARTGEVSPSKLLLGIKEANAADQARKAGVEVKEAYLSTVPDLDIGRRIYELERKVKQAQKNNLSLLASSDINNPLLQLRDAKIAQITKNIEVLKDNLAIAEVGLVSGEKKDKEKYSSTLKKLREEELKLDKVKNETKEKQDAALFKMNKKSLDLKKKSLDLELKNIAKQIDAAQADGDISALRNLQEQRRLVTEGLLQTEKAALRHTGQSAKLTKKILEDKRATADAELQVKDATEFLAAVAQNLSDQYVTGSFNTQDEYRDAYRGTAGFAPSRQETATELARQNDELRASLDEVEASYYAKVQAGNADQAAMLEYTEKVDSLNSQLGGLQANLDAVTIRATFGGQVGDLLNLSKLQVGLEGLGSDISNLANNIRDDLLGAIDSIGPAFVDAFLEGSSFSEAMRNLFADMFANFARTFASNAVNEVAKKALGKLGEYFDIDVNVTGDPQVDAQNRNTAATEANTRALLGQNPIFGYMGEGAEESSSGGWVEGLLGYLGGGTSSEAGPADIGDGSNFDAIWNSNMQGFQTVASATIESGENNVKATEVQTGKTEGFFGGLAGGFQSIFGAIFGGGAGGSGGFDWGGLVTGLIGSFVGGASKGGVISGPGTSTSDSIPALVQDRRGRVSGLLAVSNRESILTAEATKVLGEDFIHKLNSGMLRPMQYAAGGVISGTSRVVREASTAGSRLSKNFSNIAPPVVTANNQTRIVNVVDPDLAKEYMTSADGEKTQLNFIRRNSGAIKQMLV